MFRVERFWIMVCHNVHNISRLQNKETNRFVKFIFVLLVLPAKPSNLKRISTCVQVSSRKCFLLRYGKQFARKNAFFKLLA